MCDIFSFFESKVRTCPFGMRNKTGQLFFLQKIFLFHPDNVNEFRQLTRDHM